MKTAFHDVRLEDFPFEVEAFDLTGRVVWQVTVAGPGSLHIPDLASTHGPVGVKLTTARGITTVTPPPSQ